MAEYLIQSETLDDIADAINAKTGGSSAMTPAEMAAAIGSISGGDLGDFTLLDTITISESVASVLVTYPQGYTQVAFIFDVENSAVTKRYFYRVKAGENNRNIGASNTALTFHDGVIFERFPAATISGVSVGPHFVARGGTRYSDTTVRVPSDPDSVLMTAETSGALFTSGTIKVYAR